MGHLKKDFFGNEDSHVCHLYWSAVRRGSVRSFLLKGLCLKWLIMKDRQALAMSTQGIWFLCLFWKRESYDLIVLQMIEKQHIQAFLLLIAQTERRPSQVTRFLHISPLLNAFWGSRLSNLRSATILFLALYPLVVFFNMLVSLHYIFLLDCSSFHNILLIPSPLC